MPQNILPCPSPFFHPANIRRSWPRLAAPSVRSEQPALTDLDLLAAALKRLLAQWPPHVSKRCFPVATKVSKALRIQSGLSRDVRISPYVLSDLCHEIAEYVDAPVRAAAVRCLRDGCARPEADQSSRSIRTSGR